VLAEDRFLALAEQRLRTALQEFQAVTMAAVEAVPL
jgi:hypothetical protein